MSDRIAVMNAGRVEQIASPTEIYHEPASVFVAGFIGQANIWPAETIGTASSAEMVSVEALGTTLRAVRASDLQLGVPASLMVRPERVSVTTTRPSSDTDHLACVVTDLVFQGPVVRIALAVADGSTLIAHLGPGAELPLLRPGDQVWASWSPAAACALPAGSPPEPDDPVPEE
jgi:spermidine/putrescine transport system ATP-binding protein